MRIGKEDKQLGHARPYVHSTLAHTHKPSFNPVFLHVHAHSSLDLSLNKPNTDCNLNTSLNLFYLKTAFFGPTLKVLKLINDPKTYRCEIIKSVILN